MRAKSDIDLGPSFTARHRFARITARKARLVADLIRGRSANEAVEMLGFSPKRAAYFYAKVLKSAMANAGQDEEVNLNRLVIVDCRADDGPMLGNALRWHAGPQGRAMPFAKKTSHLTVTVAELLDDAKRGRGRTERDAAEQEA